MPNEVLSVLGTVRNVFPNIDMVHFNRGFYSKDLNNETEQSFSPIHNIRAKERNGKEGTEINEYGREEINNSPVLNILDERKLNGYTKLAFLRSIFDGKT